MSPCHHRSCPTVPTPLRSVRCTLVEGRGAPGGWALSRRETILLEEGEEDAIQCAAKTPCPLRPHAEAIFRAEDILQDLGQPSLGAIANHCIEFMGAPGHT